MSYTNLNGKMVAPGQATIAADNGAFRYGVGLFETMLVQNGEVRLKSYHWERLFSGLSQIRFDIPKHFSPEMLEQEVLRTVDKNKMGALCRVRLQVYAGGGGIFGQEHQSPYFVIECYELEPETMQINENGLVLGVAEGLKKSNDSLCNLKTSNALVYAMAAHQAKEQRWNDALVCNNEGNIIESAIANIFRVKDGIIYTPPLSEGCIAGVMRRHILHSVKDIVELPLTRADLLAADEVFLTNAIKTIRWVGGIEDVKYSNVTTQGLLGGLF